MSQKVAEEKSDVAPGVPEKPPKSGKLVLIVGVVVVLITAQAAITWILMPKPADAKAEDSASVKTPAGAGDENGESPAAESTEVPIGDFNSTNSTDPGMVVHVNFKLVAIATAGGPASKLEAQLKQHSGRVRQLVNQIVRRSSLEDLNDPNLSTIKRLIRQEMNRLLRSSYVTEVVISDITTMQQ